MWLAIRDLKVFFWGAVSSVGGFYDTASSEVQCFMMMSLNGTCYITYQHILLNYIVLGCVERFYCNLKGTGLVISGCRSSVLPFLYFRFDISTTRDIL